MNHHSCSLCAGMSFHVDAVAVGIIGAARYWQTKEKRLHRLLLTVPPALLCSIPFFHFFCFPFMLIYTDNNAYVPADYFSECGS